MNPGAARGAVVASVGLMLLPPVHAQQMPGWSDTFVTRLEALALMQTLNADLLGSRSATRTLENWCRDHRLAANATIVAHPLPGVNKLPTTEQRQRLQVADKEEVRYRRVQLSCGTHVLSEAENWYVPARLTPEMNRLLDTTEAPFGKVVVALEPYRQTIEVLLLWAPLPENWERDAGRLPASTERALQIPDALFEHRAVLYTAAHLPFAEVAEIYQRDLLAFPPPRFH